MISLESIKMGITIDNQQSQTSESHETTFPNRAPDHGALPIRVHLCSSVVPGLTSDSAQARTH